MPKLTNKRKRFCEEYMIDLNGTQAAIRAGYSKKTAVEQASRLLSFVNVRDHIVKLREAQKERTDITADRVLKELALIGFLDIREAFDEDGNLLSIKEMPEDVARAIGGLEITQIKSKELEFESLKKIKLIDKKGALELIGRHLAMFNDKLELDITSKWKEVIKECGIPD